LSQESKSNPVAALRDEIRWKATQIQTGRRRAVRACLYAAVTLLVGTLAAVISAAFIQAIQSFGTYEKGSPLFGEAAIDIGFSIAVFGGMAAAALCLVAALCRRTRAADEIGQRLSVLPPEQRWEVLSSLSGDRLGDTRAIARSLSERFAISREVAAAGLLDGRGDEPTGA